MGKYKPNKSLQRQLDLYLLQKLDDVGDHVAGKAKESMKQGNSDGKNPSRPGQTPAVQTGVLRSSIFHKVDTRTLTVFVGVDASSPANKYGAALEFGTSKMEPRPFLRPAILASKAAITTIFGV